MGGCRSRQGLSCRGTSMHFIGARNCFIHDFHRLISHLLVLAVAGQHEHPPIGELLRMQRMDALVKSVGENQVQESTAAFERLREHIIYPALPI